MKIWSSELGHSYDSYSFGYCNYCTYEKGDRLSDIYEFGYLPYSGRLDVKDTFYMARSARVDLKKFSLSSENRRVQRKFDGALVRECIAFTDFDYQDKKFLDFCLSYFKGRHGSVMPRKRLLHILEMDLMTDLVLYRKDKEIVAYVLEVSNESMTHFWFSFYDLAYVNQSLGLWLMLDSLLYAKKSKRKYFYIGTVYGEKALYKTNFPALEYWSGNKWCDDVKALKIRARSDTSRVITIVDEWETSSE